jgi:glycosyltransferase involved in cell wall biosynthesis
MTEMKEKKTPEFSVIIPAYNAEKFIGTAVQSVQNQTFDDWELIIVENGSNDATTALCEGFLSDSRIRLLHSAKGVSRARNAGIDAAEGKWLIFLDADDLLLEDALKKFDEIDRKYAPDFILGEYEIPGESETGKEVLFQGDTLKDFLAVSLENPTQKCNTKAVAFQNATAQSRGVRFDPEIAYAEDSVFFLEMFFYAETAVDCHYPVYRVVYHPGSTVRSGKNLVREYLPAIHKVKSVVDRCQPGFENMQHIFVINQLLVIFVNDIFARKESWRSQIRDAREAMKIPEYQEAIKNAGLSDLHGLKKMVFLMIRKKFMIGVLLAVRIRQAQNVKKEETFHV